MLIVWKDNEVFVTTLTGSDSLIDWFLNRPNRSWGIMHGSYACDVILSSRYTMVRAPIRYKKKVFQGIPQTNMMAIDLPKKVSNLKENSGDLKARKPIRTSEQTEWNGITFFSWLQIVLFRRDQKKTAINLKVKGITVNQPSWSTSSFPFVDKVSSQNRTACLGLL